MTHMKITIDGNKMNLNVNRAMQCGALIPDMDITSFELGDVFGLNCGTNIVMLSAGQVSGQPNKYCLGGSAGNPLRTFCDAPMTYGEMLNYLNNNKVKFSHKITFAKDALYPNK